MKKHRELTDDEKKRISAAQEAIDAILDNYHVALVPTLVLMQGQIVQHSVGILPQKEERRIVVPEFKKEKVPPINMEG